MNKIFKTKYDITTGQCKAVSELASNRQIASSSESKPKCGGFLGNFLGAFKLAPLALALSVVLPVEVWGYSPGVSGLQDGEAKDVENMMKTGIKGEGFIDVDVGSFTCSKQSNGVGGGFGSSNSQVIHNCSSSPIKIKLNDEITQKITKATGLSDLFSRGSTETAPDGTTFHVFDGNISVNWKNAGTGASKQVIEVGKQGSESLLKHVAAGKVEDGSTYAVNGGQLYSVIEFFGEFGKKVLGAEVFDDGTQKNYRFGKTTFKGVEYNGSSSPAGKTTFKDAINEAINAINQGMTFKVGGNGSGSGSSNNNTIKRQLGQSLTFKGDDYLTLSTESSSSGGSGNNSKDTIKLAVNVATSIDGMTGNSGGSSTSNPEDKKLTTVKAVKDYVNSKITSGGGSGGSSTGTQSLHYLSVNDGTNGAGGGSSGSSSGSQKGNYNNDGAKMEGAIAIGVGAEATEKYAIALGYEAKSKAEQAIVIGKDLNVDVKHSVLLGSDITVTQSDKNKQDAVVAVGNGVTFSNAKGSIAISAVNEGDGSDHTKLDNAEWSLAIGNKTKINSGTDIVALGNNINIGNGNGNSNNDNKANSNVVAIGNKANAQNAKNSVLIGAETKAENGAKNAVIIGYQAQSKAKGGVAIGESAVVETAAGDSIALGKNSKATATKTAISSADLNVGTESLTFRWTGGGAGMNKSVVSVGDVGNERIITNVAAGTLTEGSTDAVNAAQLVSVIDVFGKLGTDILGAEVDKSSKTFKNSSFAKLKDASGNETSSNAPSTFKDAIDKNIAKINEGLKFKVENGTSAGGSAGNSTEMTRQLGATVTFKTGQHLKASLDDSKGEISFNVEATDSITDSTASGGSNGGGSSNAGTQSNKLVTEMAVRNYLTEKLKNVGGTLSLKGDNTKNTDYGKVELNKAQLEIKGDGDIVTEVKQDQPTVTIKLGESVKKKLDIINVGTTNNGDNSFALGKNSQIVTKKTAPSGTTQNTGQSEVTISWKNAGASADTMEGNKKEVVSVGSTGSERIITHVAAGEVRDGSTDAINGGQLYNVIQVFGKLGTEVLGAEKNDRGDGFKKTTFTALKDTSGGNQATKDTFKDAINANISKINEGLKFAVETGGGAQSSMASGNGPLTRQLGSTLTFGGDSYLTPSLDNSGGKITFKLKVATSISDTNSGSTTDQNDNKLVTVSAVKEYLKNQLNSLTLKIEADNSNTAQAQAGGQAQSAAPSTPSSSGQSQSSNGKVQGAVKIQSQALQVLGTTDEIETKVEQGKQNVTLKLAKKVTDKLDIIQLSQDSNDGSFALGKNSKLEKTKNAFASADINVGKNSLTFNWKNAGTSKDGQFNSVVSVGDKDKERIITHVAAGKVDASSTDAINGGQLAEVIRVFGNLGTDILGAEVDDQTKQFKKTTFTKLKDKDGKDDKVTAATTFKEAIDKNIETINKGLIFEVDNGTTTTTTTAPQTGGTSTNKMTRQLGATIKFKGDDYIKPSIDADTGTISFKIEATEEIKENGSADGSGGNSSAEDKKLTTAKAVKDFVNSKIKTITDQQTEADKIAVKYDDEHKKSITLGGKPKNGGKAHDPVAINNLKSGLGLDDMKDKPDSQKNGLSLELVKKLVSNGISSQQGQKMTEQDLHRAANLADLKAVAQAGLRFKGNQGDDVVRKISDTLTIKGEEETQNSQATSSFSSAAGNIKVETNSDKNGLEIKLSDTLKNMKAFETKEESGKKSTLNSDGLTVVNKGKDGKDNGTSATYGADNIMLEDKGKNNKATITAESLIFADNTSAQNQKMPKTVLDKKGLTVTGANDEIKIDGENGIITVPDIKPDADGKVVVNKKYVDGKNNELRVQLNNASRESRAGIAGALAAAGLPMSSVPGKSMFAASAGSYKGQSAVALGYSRVSDNGKITLRLQGTRSSTGDVGGSVGVGYQW